MKPDHSSGTDGVIAWFVRNPVAANLMMGATLLLGLVTAADLRREGFPAIEPGTVSVSVVFPSGSAQQAEEGVSIKVEEALQGLSGVDKITSTSTAAGAEVVVERTSGWDLDRLLDDVKQRVDTIPNFPDRAERPVIEKALWEEHAIWLQVHGDVRRETLQQVARSLRQDLLKSPQIGRVELEGWRDPEISIEVSELQLQTHGLTLADVAARVAQESLTEISGELRSEQGVIALRADRQGYHLRDFEQIVLRAGADGSRVLLGDVATVTDDYAEDPPTWMRFQGDPSVGLQVIMDGRGDIGAISEQANAVVQDWHRRGRLPDGVEVSTWYDLSKYIEGRLELLLRNGLSGIVLVVLVLAVMLNLRVAFWVAMGLPICFAGALLFMAEGALGLTINELTTFGFIIALGIVVDDAVVVGESIYGTRSREGDTLVSTIKGARSVAIPTVFGVLTTVAVFAPLSLVEGEMGEIFSQFGTVVVICLLFSIIESKFILPSHIAHISTRRPDNPRGITGLWVRVQHGADRALEFFQERVYLPVLRIALRYRYAALFVFLAMVVGAVGLVQRGIVRSVFFPDIPGDVIAVNFTVEEDAGYGLSERNLALLEQRLAELDDALMEEHGTDQPVIARVQTSLRSSVAGRLWVELSPRDQRAITTEDFTDRWRDSVGNLEGVRQIAYTSSWAGAADIQIELLADDPQQLDDAAADARATLARIRGVRDIQDNLSPGRPRIQIELTPLGRASGLTTGELASQIQQGFYGYEVQRVQRGKDEIKVRVRYPAAERRDISDLNHMRVRAPDGQVLTLESIATLQSDYELSSRIRLDGSRAAIVTAEVDKNETSPNEVIAILEASLFPRLRSDYPAVRIQLAGEAQEDATTTASLQTVFMISLTIVYILLAVPLRSYFQPLLIMSVIPFGIVGAILGHWAYDLPLSLLSTFGILALSGVVVNDSLMYVARFNEIHASDVPFHEALVTAGRTRLRAIILTSLTTFAGLAPLLREKSEQAQYLIPPALSLAYGVLFATGITLVLVPVLLAIFHDVKTLGTWPRRSSSTEPSASPK